MIDVSAMAPGSFSGLAKLGRVRAHRYRVLGPLHYKTRAGLLITIERGFETDGASVPRPLWWLYPAIGGNYTEAAILHDYLYVYAERYAEHGFLERGACDGLFNEAMDVMQCRDTQRKVLYAGVRVGGWKPWRKYRTAAKERTA